MYTQIQDSMNCAYKEPQGNCDENKPTQTPPSYLVETSSPLSSVSIPSPPSVSPTPEMYNKQMLYQNVSQLKVQNQTPGPSSMENNSSSIMVQPEDVVHYRPRQQSQHQMYVGRSANSLDNTQLNESVRCIQELKHFLLTAPTQFQSTDIIHQFRLPTDEQISCVRWHRNFCITGTDIVRILAFRFSLFGRDIINRKKFEEGVFSDLRNLKINVDATLENPKSELLEFLYKRHCVRTKKKQKVFFWHSVHHDQLFIDALERELKKDAVANGGIVTNITLQNSSSSASTLSQREPALSFKYDASLPLIEQLRDSCETMPRHYADLITEITTSDISSEYKPQTSMYGHVEEAITGYSNEIPTTPIRQPTTMDKYNFDISMMLTPYEKAANAAAHNKQDLKGHMYGEQPQLHAHSSYYSSPQRFNDHGVPKTPYQHDSNSFLYQTPPRNVTPVRRPTVDLTISDTSSFTTPSRTPLSLKYPEDPDQLDVSDFPLDVLVKEDESSLRYSDLNSTFENKFTNFAHHNRPALSLQNGNNTLLVHDGPVSPYMPGSVHLDSSMLNHSYPTQSYSILGNGSTLPSSLYPPQSPDWDQYICPDPLGVGSGRQPESTSQSNGNTSAFSTGTSITTDDSTTQSILSEAVGQRRDPSTSKYQNSVGVRVMKQPPYQRKKSANYLSHVVDEY